MKHMDKFGILVDGSSEKENKNFIQVRLQKSTGYLEWGVY